MQGRPDPFLDQLIADLKPVTKMQPKLAMSRTAIAALLTIVALAVINGLRTNLSATFGFGSIAFLALGAAATYAAVVSGIPRVGSKQTGWIWAAALVSLLALSAIVMALPQMSVAQFETDLNASLHCIGMGMLCGLSSGLVLVAWLRQGAPASPEKSGLLIGLAAGALGAFISSLACPIDGFIHIAFWHSTSVAGSALLGRCILPQLIRW